MEFLSLKTICRVLQSFYLFLDMLLGYNQLKQNKIKQCMALGTEHLGNPFGYFFILFCTVYSHNIEGSSQYNADLLTLLCCMEFSVDQSLSPVWVKFACVCVCVCAPLFLSCVSVLLYWKNFHKAEGLWSSMSVYTRRQEW